MTTGTASVHTILKHINKPHCLFCGRGVPERNALVAHIATCGVYLDYRDDLNEVKRQRSEYATRADNAEVELTKAYETIANLQAKIEILEADALKASVEEAGEDEPDSDKGSSPAED